MNTENIKTIADTIIKEMFADGDVGLYDVLPIPIKIKNGPELKIFVFQDDHDYSVLVTGSWHDMNYKVILTIINTLIDDPEFLGGLSPDLWQINAGLLNTQTLEFIRPNGPDIEIDFEEIENNDNQLVFGYLKLLIDSSNEIDFTQGG